MWAGKERGVGVEVGGGAAAAIWPSLRGYGGGMPVRWKMIE